MSKADSTENYNQIKPFICYKILISILSNSSKTFQVVSSKNYNDFDKELTQISLGKIMQLSTLFQLKEKVLTPNKGY